MLRKLEGNVQFKADILQVLAKQESRALRIRIFVRRAADNAAEVEQWTIFNRLSTVPLA
jgi:hypothetical protein